MSIFRTKYQYIGRTLFIALWLLTVLYCLVTFRPQFWQPAHDLYLMAVTEKNQGHGEKALACMREALAAEFDNPGYLIFAANLEIEYGKASSAVQYFKSAMDLEPESEEARLGLARALIADHKPEQVAGVLNPIDMSNLNRGQKRRVAGLYALAGNDAEAFEVAKEILAEADESDWELIRQVLQLAAANQQWDYLLSVPTEQLLESGSVGIKQEVANQKAVALRASGKLGEAYDLFRKNPDDSNLAARAELAVQLELWEDAVGLLQELISHEPANVRLLRMQAYALYKAGLLTEAAGKYSALLQSGQADKLSKIRYVWLLNEIGDYTEAWGVLEGIDETDDDYGLLSLRAQTAYWSGEMEAASKYLQQLIAMKKENISNEDK